LDGSKGRCSCNVVETYANLFPYAPIGIEKGSYISLNQ